MNNKIVEHLGRAVKAKTSLQIKVHCIGWWVRLPQMFHFLLKQINQFNHRNKIIK